MLIALLSIYIGWLLGLVLATVILIFCGCDWGPLPHIYLRLVECLQNFYPQCYPQTDSIGWPAIIERSERSVLEKHRNDSLSSFKFSEIPPISAFDVCSDAFKAGFEAVVQDQLSVAFDSAPSYHTTLLEYPGRLPFPDSSSPISRRHISGYFMALLFRYGVLLPTRLCLIIISFIFSTTVLIADQFMDMSKEQRLRVGVMYCRLFCAGIGLVANYHNRQYRPKQPGIAVANHLSPNDVHIIYADVDPYEGYGFTVTGQRHGGIIWILERIVERFIPTLWLERRNINDRKRFTYEVLKEAKHSGPILIFPEGYCTNNTHVLLFRRAVFEKEIVIYPIAIRQHPRFGDSFWFEDQFWRYLLRILTSWAIVYDITYLEPQQKHFDESNQEFAKRIQNAIAETANAESVSFDGRLWYMKSEQERLKLLQMKNIAKRLNEMVNKKIIAKVKNMSKITKQMNGFNSAILPTISADAF